MTNVTLKGDSAHESGVAPQAVRIVGGKWAGLELVSPGRRVRPTTEEVRDRWLRLLTDDIPDARVLDLFAGSGALGLEALSRGAATVDFVENGSASLHALKANVAKMRIKTRCRVFKRDAIPFVERIDGAAYDITFADPPYRSRKLDRVLNRWLLLPFSRILCLEHDRDHELPPGGRRHDFGDTSITVFRI